jgi:uncharacterized iron-regulated membrane protein
VPGNRYAQSARRAKLGALVNQAQRRDLWTRIHRWLGLFAMAFLAVAAITGCILCFAQPLDRVLNPELFRSAGGGAALRPVEAVARLQSERPELRILSFPVNLVPGRNLVVQIKPGKDGFDQLFLDPATARIVGGRERGPGWDRAHLVAGISELHEHLLAGKWGRWLLGLAALAWLIGNLVGVYLTWPRKAPYLKSWRRTWRFSTKSSLPRLLLDLHRATGLWLLIGLTILAFTSVAFNFYREVYEPTVTRIAPLKYRLFDRDAPFPKSDARPSLGFADALKLGEARRKEEGLSWRPATLLYRPDWNLYGVTFTNDGELNYRQLGPIYLYFDGNDGRFVHRVDPYADSAGLVMIRMLYPLHSGKVAGWPTVVLVFLLGLATLEQAGTGFYIWWKKRRSRKLGKRPQHSAVAG